RRRHEAYLLIVEARNRGVLRHAQAGLLEAAKGADRDFIVQREEGGRPVRLADKARREGATVFEAAFSDLPRIYSQAVRSVDSRHVRQNDFDSGKPVDD